MKTIDEFLSELRSLNIKVWNEGESLRYKAPKGSLKPPLLSQLRERKTEILEFLKNFNTVANSNFTQISATSRDREMPLSYAQQRLWLIDRLESEISAYNMARVAHLRGQLNVAALEQSLTEIISRHEILRATFPTINGQPRLVITPTQSLNIPVVDLQSLVESDRDTKVEQLVSEEAQRPFDLSTGPLIRCQLLKSSPTDHTLIVNIHHIVFDGWSSHLFFNELSTLYSAYCRNEPSPLPKLPIQYADFALWQQQQAKTANFESQLNYWKQKLGGTLPRLELPTDYPRPDQQDYRSGRHTLELSVSLTAQLETVSQQFGTTLFMTLLAALNVVLHRQSGQDDIIVGTPIAGRPQVETEGLIGLFLNSLALRTNLEDNPTFARLLGQVRDLTLAAYENQDVPFERLVREINPERSLSRHPIFEVMLNFANMPKTAWEMPELNLSHVTAGVDNGESKFAITLYVKKQQGKLHLTLVYQSALFSAPRMRDFLAQYQCLLEQVVVEPNRPICAYSLVSKSAATILPDPTLSILTKDYQPVPLTVLDWGQQHPNRPAICQGEQYWNYGELRKRANAIAQLLLSRGLKPGNTVAVSGERSFGMIASILGVLRAGGVLLLLEPQLPETRQQTMLQEAAAKGLLYAGWESTTETAEEPEENAMSQALWKYTITPQTAEVVLPTAQISTPQNQLPNLQADDPAYIFFTSGTTGVPKGVLGCHKGLAHFLSWQRQKFDIKPSDRVAQLTSLSFDVVLRDILLPLTSGGVLCLPTFDLDLSAKTVFSWLEQQQITVLHTVPTLAKMWLVERSQETTKSQCLPRQLRWLFSAGEPLSDQLVKQWRAAFPKMGEIVNLYGPTETTLAKCYYLVPEEPVLGTQPIGQPLPETQALILSSNGQLCGIGEIGEIVVRTPFASLGYINAPEEQQKRFRQNPYRKEFEDRLFYTGDLGRYRLDGSIEILSRIDQQVKIRGVRIEPREIETVVLGHPAIREAVVLARKNPQSEKYLVAYVVPKLMGEKSATSSVSLNTNKLRQYLSQQLPEYMMPSALVFLKALPLTPNGKINRQALPEPEIDRSWLNSSFVAPRTATEQQLAEIWTEVLQLKQVGIYDNFFELGGHSLLATQVVSRIAQIFEVELPLRTLFETPTIAGLSNFIEQSAGSLQGQPIIPKRRHSDSAELSFAQQRLWFLSQLEPESIAYHMTRRLRLHGILDVDVLQQTLSSIVERHETLRTRFIARQGTPLQLITSAKPFELALVDISSLSSEQQSQKLATVLTSIVERPYNLSQELMLRAVLVRLSEQEHVLQIVLHHIAADGWSMSILVRELSAFYQAHLKQQPHNLPELAIQYADFAAWQRSWLSGDRMDSLLDYWKQQLKGAPSAINLATDRLRPSKPTYRGNKVKFQLSTSLSNQLRQLSQQSGATLFMTLLAAFNILLSRYSRQEDLVVGFPIANRTNPQVEKLIGFFANTLALRTDLSNNPNFTTLLSQVRRVALEAYEHQDLPFEKLVEELQPERDLSVSPIFQVMLVFQNTPQSEYQLEDLKVSSEKTIRETTKFDLTMTIQDNSEQLQGTLTYSTDLFDRATIKLMASHFQTLLLGIVRDPLLPIAKLPLLTEHQQRELVKKWHNAKPNYSDNLCLHQLFEQQVLDTPNAVAIVCQDQSLTYRELNLRANQVARYLKQQNVDSDEIVALCTKRSIEMMVGLLGILKAGAAYLPLDPQHQSAQRLGAIISDASVSIVLTQDDCLEQLAKVTAHKLCLDRDWQTVGEYSGEDLAVEVSPHNLAYVIYTSGSTGQPKGVTIEHRQIVSYLQAIIERLEFVTHSSFALVSTLAADLGNTMVFPALCTGGQLHVLSWECITSPVEFANYITHYQIDYLKIVPSHLRALQSGDGNHLKRILPQKGLILGGEALTTEWVKSLMESGSQCAIFNHYGPTETTVGVLTYRVPEELPNLPTIPLGYPLDNSQVYLLDSEQNLVPVGVPGEIYIGGSGVARGYLNRAELTAARFLNHPFAATGHLYRTGDLGRYRADGTMEFLGRIDQQVKIRGFRIELGEIEAALLQHPAVRQTVVLVAEVTSGDKRIAAYVVLEPATGIQQLRQYLSQQLPDYMIPAVFVPIDGVPLTPNGKVDSTALAVPDWSKRQSEQELVAPRTATEQQLAEIWQEVLQQEQVGIYDNFFELGGHSLLATQVVSRIAQAFEIELPLRTLFETPTIAGLSNFIEQSAGSLQGQPIIPKRRHSDSAELSFAQQRLWFLSQLEPESIAYHMTRRLRLHGILDVDVLQQTLSSIVERHETLRTRFIARQGTPLQLITSAKPFELALVDISSLSSEQQSQKLATVLTSIVERPYNLSQELMLRAVLVRLSEQEHVLQIVLHHIAADGWSMSILVRELSAFYQAHLKQQPHNLPELAIQYADFAAWQRSWLSGDRMDSLLDYWKQQLKGAPSAINLATDRLRPSKPTYRGNKVKFQLSTSLSNQLRQLSQQSGATLFMTLLAAFNILLSRYSRQEDLVVGFPIANRTNPQVEKLIGFFANTLALRTDLSNNPNFTTLLSQVRRVALEAYEHQDLPFEKLVEELQPERDLSVSPIFQVMLVFQNTPQSEYQLEDLKVSSEKTIRETTKFDLTMTIQDNSEQLQGTLTYSTDLFDRATIKLMASHFQTLLLGIVRDPLLPIAKLPLLTEHQQRELVKKWHNAKPNYSDNLCLHQLFEQQVLDTPNAVAIVCQDQSLTYRELNLRANQVARYLKQQNVDSDEIVALCTKRSIEMMVGLLGILKAGAAYLPLDPQHQSAQRLGAIISDASVSIVLTQDDCLEQLAKVTAHKLCLDRDWQTVGEYSGEDLAVEVSPHNLAYVIYTSGSTGQPKGVTIEHRQIVSYLQAIIERLEFVTHSSFALVSTLAADLGNTMVFPALCTGGQLHVLSWECITSPVEFANYITHYQIDYLKIVPSHLRALQSGDGNHLKRILPQKGLILGGEALTTEWVKSLMESGSQCAIFNHYGPTETTVGVLTYRVPEELPNLPTIPLGYPLDNSQVYLLDSEQNLVPVGVPGEIYIGGSGVARGYLNRAELTAARFLNHPFAATGHLYRTGDLGRYRADGTMEFLGRIDQQVKIRGFRIELGEIEAALLQHPAVRQTVVLVAEVTSGDKRIAAYVVLEPATGIQQLRQYLSQQLPDYMIPAVFVPIDGVPLTPNGKVDFTALAAPDWSKRQSERELVAPRTDTEQQLAEIWTEVLQQEQVGIYDNFFELGGHSLLATQVVSRIAQVFEVELPLRTLFETPTIAGLSNFVEQNAQTNVNISIAHRDESIPCPASFSQQRWWFLQQLEPDKPIHNIYRLFKLDESIGVDTVRQVLNAIVARHEALRTVITMENGQLIQKILDEVRSQIPIVKIDCDSPEDVLFKARIIREVHQPFDFERDLMLRCRVFLMGEMRVLLVVMPHLVSDHWSWDIFIKELNSLTGAFMSHQPAPLKALSIQYADFAAWQKNFFQSSAGQKQLDYWVKQLAGDLPVLNLVQGKRKQLEPSYVGKRQKISLSPELIKDLKRIGARQNATLFMVLLTALNVLFYRRTGQDDILLGAVTSGRQKYETERLIGCFQNTVALRTRLSDDLTFEELLQRVRSTSLETYENQDLPFEELIRKIQPQRNLSLSPLFNVFLSFINIPDSVSESDVSYFESLSSTGPALFDLMIFIKENNEALGITFSYSVDLFDDETIKRMLDELQILLKGIAINSEETIDRLPILSEAEKELLLFDLNQTHQEYPVDILLHQLFEAQVEKTPNAIAAKFADRELSYQALNARANQLARYLQSTGVKLGDLVTVCLDRSLEMIVTLLAILKAGGAYVPIDPTYPSDRIAYMLNDAKAAALITQTVLSERLPTSTTRVVNLDRIETLIVREKDTNLNLDIAAERLAYVIYTSGSTGKPKGAMNAHRGIVNRILWMQETYRLSPETDKILQKTPFSFDVSVWEFFWSLSTGASLVFARPEGHKDPEYLARLIAREGITTVHFVPSMLRAFLDSTGLIHCNSLKRVICSGEALTFELQKRFFQHFDCELYNLYGPTEAAIDVSYWQCQRNDASGTVPIGYPVANTQLYILNGSLEPMPIGTPGELYIGGMQVGKGYLNQPELTLQKFISNPFGTGRLYKTGDLAYYRTDGAIEYLGRTDYQIKLRGFRIELGEIESALVEHSQVKEAVVIAVKSQSGQQRLIAYFTKDNTAATPITSSVNNEALETIELANFLKKMLPEYMVPFTFVMLESIPLTPNGKVDRKALPIPDLARRSRYSEFVAPKTPAEKQLAQIWCALLELEQVSSNDNFFELGGHSLLATQVISRIRENFGVELPLRTLFESSTISTLAIEIEQQENTTRQQAIEPISDGDKFPLSFAQQRLWLIDKLESGTSAYNMTRVARLKGELNVTCLEKSLTEIIRRHEVLRTTIETVDGQPKQVIKPASQLNIPIADLQSLNTTTTELDKRVQQLIAEETRRPFSLASEPLIRIRLLKVNPREHILILNVHHIVFDGWSSNILFNELSVLYSAFCKEEASPLAPLSIQYKDFAHWQRQQSQSANFQSQLDYWKQQLGGTLPMLELPTDYPRPRQQDHRSGCVRAVISKSLTTQLKNLSQQSGVTLFMTLLAALNVILHRQSGQDDIIVGTPIAGRPQLETEKLIGLFLNSLALRTKLDGNPTFKQLLARVRKLTLGAYENQDVPFEKLVREINPERSLSRHPIFEVMLNFANMPKTDWQMPGLNLKQIKAGNEESKFALTLYVKEDGAQLHLRLVYQKALFEAARMEDFLAQYQSLLTQVAHQPHRPILSYSLVTQQAASRLPNPKTPIVAIEYEPVPDTVFNWSRRQPAQTAICQGSKIWTYGELAEKANAIASILKSQGLQPRSTIAVSGERSFGMIASILGILRAGGVLLLVDPQLPLARQQLMLEQAKATGLLSVKSELTVNLEKAPTLKAQEPQAWWEYSIVSTTGQLLHPAAKASLANTQLEEIPLDAPAYIFFTSGTTGTPKGVLGSHQGLAHFISWQRQRFEIGTRDRVAQLTGLSFDVVLRDIFLPLTSGATLCLPTPEIDLSAKTVFSWLEQQQITVMHTVPTLAKTWLMELKQSLGKEVPSFPQHLRWLFSAGEPLSDQLVKQWRATFPKTGEIVNLYGPTETTLAKCYYLIPEEPTPGIQPVGRALPQTQALILSLDGQLCGIGETGEIVIRTPFSSIGYINAPQEQQKRFRANPYRAESQERVFYTGDLGRYRANGTIEILGRIDQQVKIRGIRIELGEIEAALLQHPAVRQSVVLVRQDTSGDKRIVAYVVLEPTTAIQQLRQYLSQQLPDYTIPAVFVPIDGVPLTPNGKVDSTALAAPDWSERRSERELVAPRTAIEQQLAKIWAEVLQQEQIGVYDNFFELGGHSLLATQVIARMREALVIDLPLRKLFEYPTIASLAEAIAQECQLMQQKAQTKMDMPKIMPKSRQGRRNKRSSLS